MANSRPTNNESNFESLATSKRRKVWKRFSNIVFGRTIAQKMFRLYFLVIFLGAGLLMCPFSLHNGYTIIIDPLDPDSSTRKFKFWDALFIACSAFSDTGLTPAVISESFTITGQVLILILIQVGGIGLISIFFLIWNLFNKWDKVALDQMIMMQAERGNEKVGNTYRMVRKSIFFILIIEIVFALFYSIWMCCVPAYQQQLVLVPIGDGTQVDTTTDTTQLLNCYHNYGLSLWIALFTSISAINNAGFDIFQGTSSLASYRNDWHIIFQLFIVVQIIIGGIGYPVIFDVLDKKKNLKKGVRTRTSLFTKVALWSYAIVAIVGLVSAYTFESINYFVNTDNYSIFSSSYNSAKQFGHAEKFNEIWSVFFNVMVTRSAGFSTYSHNLLSIGTKWSNCALMFIGGSPSSTAGGIRTTTFTIVIMAIWNRAFGKNNLVLFKRTIPSKKVKDSLIAFTSAIILIVLFSLLINYSQHEMSQTQDYDLLSIFYECTSAFGTVGLSVGITSSIKWFGQVLLIILMFVGQLGVTSTLLSWTRRNPKGNLAVYPEEDIRIG